MDLEGNIAVFEPISVFQLINLAQASGELTLDIGDNAASVFFDGGSVTYAEITNRRVKLGEYLVKHKLVSQKILDKMLAKKRKGKKLGRLLVDNDIIDEEALRGALEDQIKDVVYEVVRWKRGWFHFNADKTPDAQDVSIDIPLDSLILEGLKRADEEVEDAG